MAKMKDISHFESKKSTSAKRIMSGLCYRCGCVLEIGDIKHRACAECREKLRIRVAKKKKQKKQKYEIEEVNRMAKERGISYGIMNLILEGYINEKQ